MSGCRASRGGPRAAVMALACAAGLALVACVGGPQSGNRARDAATYNTQLGIGYLHQGDLALAKDKLDRALEENPHDPNVHSARALLFDRMGQQDKADAEFRTALRLSPREPDVLNNYAVYLCRTGRADEGVRRFEEAARDPLYRTPEVAWTNAAVCLRGAKRETEARTDLQRALQIRPNYAEAAFQLADLDFQGGRTDAARTHIDEYLRTFDATPDLLLLGVRVARAQADRSGAERYARRLRLDFPGSDQARALADLDRNPG